MSGTELVNAIFVFDKKSGRPYIRRTFGNFQAEPFLVIGFLNAIMKFAKEVGKSDLKVIDMQDLRFYFIERTLSEKISIIFTAITNISVSPLDLKFKIKTIESLFLEKYKTEELMDVSREIEFFEKFNPIIDEIIFGDVRPIPKTISGDLEQILADLIQNENIAGAGIYSFTGVQLADRLTDWQREIFLKFFNGIFTVGISGITRVTIDTHAYSIYITYLEEDCLLVVFSTSKRFLTADRSKISETIVKINEIIC
ncbi:MAG: hypothetical protein ACTSQI_00580 [Candidatus Helarchaeota archaeon]